MKKISNFLIIVLLISFSTGCKKEGSSIVTPVQMQAATNAFLKINYVSAYTANPSVQLKVNNERVSSLIAARTPFPGGGMNTPGAGSGSADYLGLRPGSTDFSVSIPHRLQEVDSILLFKTNLNLAEGKFYTLHITDTGTRTKTLLLEDELVSPANGQTRFKFVNLMPNVPFIDLYVGTTRVATNVPYLGVSPYFEIPTSSTAPTFAIRETGTSATSTALATYALFTPSNQRTYTAFAVGYKGSTDAVRRPYVSFMLNR